jgi:arginyl-tRNA--protein-N-Asp/Glu arginylyltransferase
MPEGNGGAGLATVWFAPLQHFHRTASLPCPYVPGNVERKVVTHLAGREAQTLFDELSRAGFRRSHHLAYRPACPSCRSCVPVRVDVERFRWSPSLRRVRARNADVTASELASRATAEQFRLFARYQRSRHSGSDMADMTFGDYRAMVEDTPVETCLIEFRDSVGTLVAGCLADRMDDGYSAVYSFYDPARDGRSLGTHAILWLIERAHVQGLPWIYLGYWIADARKMAYKTRFRPLEALGPQGWTRFDPPS